MKNKSMRLGVGICQKLYMDLGKVAALILEM